MERSKGIDKIDVNNIDTDKPYFKYQDMNESDIKSLIDQIKKDQTDNSKENKRLIDYLNGLLEFKQYIQVSYNQLLEKREDENKESQLQALMYLKEKEINEKLGMSFISLIRPQESANQETVNQESANQEIVNQESVNQETVNQETVNQESVNQEKIKKIKNIVNDYADDILYALIGRFGDTWESNSPLKDQKELLGIVHDKVRLRDAKKAILVRLKKDKISDCSIEKIDSIKGEFGLVMQEYIGQIIEQKKQKTVKANTMNNNQNIGKNILDKEEISERSRIVVTMGNIKQNLGTTPDQRDDKTLEEQKNYLDIWKRDYINTIKKFRDCVKTICEICKQNCIFDCDINRIKKIKNLDQTIVNLIIEMINNKDSKDTYDIKDSLKSIALQINQLFRKKN